MTITDIVVIAGNAASQQYSEQGGVVVVLIPDGRLTSNEARTHFALFDVTPQRCQQHLKIVTELPRTPSGEVKKHQLCQTFGEPGRCP